MAAILKALEKYPNGAAMLIGNGPNITARIMPSWKDLLHEAGEERIFHNHDELTNTEVYDLIELYAPPETNVKAKVAGLLGIKPEYDLSVHERIMKIAQEKKSPVLTTNFDSAFETSVGAELKHIDSKHFTRVYPWKTYYASNKLTAPCDDFGIWKVHGDIRYKDSIRLGLTDYMGSCEKARGLIMTGSGRLGNLHRKKPWSGAETWLDIWFNKPVVIFGFGYGKDEVFLRWLLIERRRYVNLLGRDMDVTYIDKKKGGGRENRKKMSII